MKKKLRITIVGYGYWGKINHSVLLKINKFQVVNIIDPVLKNNPAGDKISINEVEKSNTDLVYIATPPGSHYELATMFISRGISVVLEKPATLKASEYLKLVSLARKRGVALVVDHTFLYDPIVATIKKKLDSGLIGKIKGVEMVRTHFGNYRPDVSPLWDLAVHDISILQSLFGERKIELNNVCNFDTVGKADYLLLDFFWGSLRASLKVSWAYPKKERTIVIFGEKGTLFANLVTREASIQFFSLNNGVLKVIKHQILNFRDEETLLLAWKSFYEKINKKVVELEPVNIVKTIEIMEKELDGNTNS